MPVVAMDSGMIALMIAGGAFVLTVVDKLFGGGWNLSKNLSGVETRLSEKIEASKREIEERQDLATHDFGETVAAIKEHVRQIEFHVRDHYIRKDDFIIHMKAHDTLLQSNFTNLSSRLERIEKKLDQ